MGRILLVQPDKGLEEFIRRGLSATHQIETINYFPSDARPPPSHQVYNVVLCSIDDPEQAIEAFDPLSEISPKALLVPIPDTAEEVERFVQQWNLELWRKEKYAGMGALWLGRRCTAGELLAFLQALAAADANEGSSSQAPPPLSIGAVLDGYRLVSLIGQGGFGGSWLAVNETTGKRVAIKVIEGTEALVQELAALRKYVHIAHLNQHLLRPEHVNRNESRLWMVNPLADSITGADTPDAYRPFSLANRLDSKGHLPEPEAIRIALGVLSALAALHEAGLLHGDVSPANILRTQGVWVLADPGLVRFVGQHGICRDRRYYPQAASVRPGDDLYAVGLTLWDMISGVWGMVSGKDSMRLDVRMLRFLSKKNLPLINIICKSVAENPNARYMNAEEMLMELGSLLTIGQEAGSPYQLYNLLHALRTGLGNDSSGT